MLRVRTAGWVVVAAVALAACAPMSAAPEEIVSSRGANASETGMGNLVADAVRSLAASDIAFIPASLLRESDIKLSHVTPEKVSAALVDPEAAIVVLPLTVAQIREGLERSVSLAPRPNNGFLQVSGLTFRYDPTQPAGKRLGDVMVGRRIISGTQTYRVAMPKTLATGGMGYFRVWGGVAPETRSPGTVSAAVRALLSGKVDLSAYLPDGRIRRI